MRRLLLFLNVNSTLILKLGFWNFARYKFTRKRKKVQLCIGGHKVCLRKGTPDLSVAISCFSGEFASLQHLLPRDFCGIIIDAGGYIGTAALAMSDLFPNARVISIEPSSENLEILKDNVSSRKNIDVVFGALVGERTEKIVLQSRGTGEWGFTSVANPSDTPSPRAIQSVPAYTLNELCDSIGSIGALKLDIEGGEHDLLVNDKETLAQIPVVYAELHDRIVDGCKSLFFEFSKDRILVKDNNEKYLSISRNVGLTSTSN